MNATRPLSIQDKIAGLRATFLEQLPERIDRARALFERLEEDPCDPYDAVVDLHRLFHSLKGTGKSFGFRELGLSAEQAEKWTNVHINAPSTPLSADWLQQMESCIQLIASQARAINDRSSQGELLFSMAPPTTTTTPEKESRILYLCDDEVLTVEKLSDQLRCFGFTTRTFTDTRSLQAAVLERRPQAVIMDIVFPHGQNAGTSVMRLLKQTTGQGLPVIFLSSRDDFAARLAAVQAGGEAYFHKPASIMELVTALDHLTDQQSPEPFRILVIDDEPEISSYHSLILEAAGMITRQSNDPSSIL
ncbi:MAG: response regulator, partial [Magnetococcales bacterium]|nr:response regulator [Magnetococcales bacterium]